MKKITELKDVFVVKIQNLYDVEKEIEKALPKLVKAASDPELTADLLSHLEETKEQSKRLEEIFNMIGENPTKIKNEGIRGILEDGNSVIKSNSSTQLRDSMIASSGRNTEHYEIAGYLSAIMDARQLGLTQIEEILQQSLKEEEEADKKLEKIIEKNFQQAEALSI